MWNVIFGRGVGVGGRGFGVDRDEQASVFLYEKKKNDYWMARKDTNIS